MHNRAHVNFIGVKDAEKFVQTLNGTGTIEKFIIENFDGSYRIDARSIMGVMYAMMDFADNMYLVNLTNDGKYPLGIDTFRA